MPNLVNVGRQPERSGASGEPLRHGRSFRDWFFFLLVASPPLVAQAGVGASDLAARLDPLVAEAESLGLRTGLVVLDPRAGQMRYQHRSREAFLPASNQKLLTVAAALRGLGPDYRFRTVFRLRKGVLEVLAGGDPNWETGGNHDPGRIFAAVATQLRGAGVSTLRGVRLDPGPFTGRLRPPGWPRDQFYTDYCAGTAGLATDAGCFRARVRPGDGRLAVVEVLAPPCSLPVTGGIRVVSRRNARFGLRDAGSHLVAHGSIYHRSEPRLVQGPLGDPCLGFGRYLHHCLAKQGIRVDPEAPAVDRELLVYETSLREALPAVLQESSNFHAELLLRVLGAETQQDGSYEGGARAVRAQLEAIAGKLPASLRLVDGSGLSRDNRVSPALLARVLGATLASRHGKELVAALAQGQRSGTLQKRFRGRDFGPRVFAKTGTLNGVSCLTGVLMDAGSQLVAFAICMNSRNSRRPRRVSTMQRLQEELVAALWESGNGH